MENKLLTAETAEECLEYLTQCVWILEKKDGEPPIPTLKQIQDMFGYNETERILTDFHDQAFSVLETMYVEAAERVKDVIGEGATDVIGWENWEALAHTMFAEIIPLYSQKDDNSFNNSVIWFHRYWLLVRKHDDSIKHPYIPFIERWIQNNTAVKITKKRDKSTPFSVLKHPIGNARTLEFVNDIGEVFATPEKVEQVEQQKLPIREQEESVLPSIMPLKIVQSSEITTKTKSGAVSHELRIFFEAIMALKPNQRREELMFRLGDLIEFLYPNGKFQWSNQLPHIARALRTLHISATIPWVDDQGSLREWRPVTVKSPLPADAHRDTPVFIDVVMPPDTKQGYMILKKIHRMLGMKSAAQWNAYHVACYLWDKFGTWEGRMFDPTKPVERRDERNKIVDGSRKPIVTQRGKELTNLYHKEAVKQLERETNLESVKKYPVLSWDDLLKACYPNGYPENNKGIYLNRAKKHWENLEVAGHIVIVKERAGWRILPPSEHVNAHRAVRTASKKR